LGYKQGLVSTWFAVYTQAGLPDDVKKILVPAAERAIKNPESKAKIEKMKLVVEYKAPADMRKKVIEEYAAALEIASKVGLLKK
jgi:tripartite-type tricarboxylate transporter receptor subunit TctC